MTNAQRVLFAGREEFHCSLGASVGGDGGRERSRTLACKPAIDFQA
jgi:hypothetical protein